MAAPMPTSRQVSETAGRILKIIAKRRAAIPNAMALFRIRRITVTPEKLASR